MSAANETVTLKASSYRRAQERQRAAEMRLRWAEEERDRAYVWARDCLDKERRLSERCEFLYGVARAHGATFEELSGSDGAARDSPYRENRKPRRGTNGRN